MFFKQLLTTSFTEKELNALDVKIPEVSLTTAQIKEIRERLKISPEEKA